MPETAGIRHAQRIHSLDKPTGRLFSGYSTSSGHFGCNKLSPHTEQRYDGSARRGALLVSPPDFAKVAVIFLGQDRDDVFALGLELAPTPFHPDARVVEACRKMADLLIEVYGEGK